MGLQFEKRYFNRKPADTKNTTVGEFIEHLRAFYKKSYSAPRADIVLKEYLTDKELEKFKHIDLRDGILCLTNDDDGSTIFGISLFEQRTAISAQVEKIMEMKANEFLMALLGKMVEMMKNK